MNNLRLLLPPWLFLALFILILFAPNITLVLVDPGIVPIVRGFLVSGLLVASLFAVFRRKLWIPVLLLSPFVLLAPAESYYVARFGHPTDTNILATVLESNLREATAWVGAAQAYLLASITAAAVLSLVTCATLLKGRLQWAHRSFMWVLWITVGVPIVSLALSLWGGHANGNTPQENASLGLRRLNLEVYATYPFGLLAQAIEYRHEWLAMRENAASHAEFRFNASMVQPARHREVVVLAIGEASRRDHWSLFGYDRQTNPQLSAISRLVPLSDMISPWAASRWAVPMIVSRKPATDWEPFFFEPSISVAFKEAGFETYWFSTQIAVGRYDSPISVAAFDAEHVNFFNPAAFQDDSVHDDILLKPLRNVLASAPGNLFIVLHTLGSHELYEARYPPAYNVFRPSSSSASGEAGRQARLNAYDNSVVFTDHVLASMIALLEETGETASLLYVADHGEMLPDSNCSVTGHGYPGLPVYPVPAFFWYSDSFAASFPKTVEAVQANSHQPLTTGNVFESLVDIGGINFPSHVTERSFASPKLQISPRLIHSNGFVDFDHHVTTSACQVVMPDARTHREMHELDLKSPLVVD